MTKNQPFYFIMELGAGLEALPEVARIEIISSKDANPKFGLIARRQTKGFTLHGYLQIRISPKD